MWALTLHPDFSFYVESGGDWCSKACVVWFYFSAAVDVGEDDVVYSDVTILSKKRLHQQPNAKNEGFVILSQKLLFYEGYGELS